MILRSENWLLKPFTVLESNDLDDIRFQISRKFRDHTMRLAGPSNGINATFRHAELPRMALSSFFFGADVEIEVDALERWSVIHFVVGSARYKTVNVEFEANHSGGAVTTASRPFGLRLDPRSFQLVVRCNAEELEQELEALTDKAVPAPITFEPILDTRHGYGAVMRRHVLSMATELSHDPSILNDPNSVSVFESRVLHILLQMHRHNYSARFEEEVPNIAPRHLSRVEEYISAYADEPITLKDLTKVAGVSGRAIQHAFQRYRGYTVMEFLKATRLREARRLLRSSDTEASVTEIAMTCGFSHLGRFSVEYKQKYGESPSQTRKKIELFGSCRPA
jgi:AraC-like DNA-binding protein